MKIEKLTASCKECSNRSYSSGGAYKCKVADETIPPDVVIAPFCPLADFPAATMASMYATIRELRTPYTRSLAITVLSHVATKLGLNLTSYGTVTIPLKDGTAVLLQYDSITHVNIQSQQWEIHFVYGTIKYMIQDGEKFELYRQVHFPGMGTSEYWTVCERA